MSSHITGDYPTATIGEAFPVDDPTWQQLAATLRDLYPGIAYARTPWGTNVGDGLDNAGAELLADAIDRDLRNGRIDADATAQAETLRRFAIFAFHSGGFTIR